MKGREENRGHLTREHSSLHNPGQCCEGYGRERTKSQGRTDTPCILSLYHMHTHGALGSRVPQSLPYVLQTFLNIYTYTFPFLAPL